MTAEPAAAHSTRALGPDLTVPVDDRYFEDYVPGGVHEWGYVTMTEDEMVAFARRYDPQPIHTDPVWAATGPFGGLIARGWHTSAEGMRLFVEHYVSHVAGLASPGMDELRWPRPVRPGDVLRARVTILEARVSGSRPDRGIVTSRLEMLNQDDDPVFTVRAVNFFGRRPT